MPIKCRLLPTKIYIEDELEPGDMFYFADQLYVVLPNRHRFNLSMAAKGFEYPDGHVVKWIVEGKPPDITLDASLQVLSDNNPKGWHGYLRNGILSDDIPGRTY